jgi:hypothetical protein
MKYDRRTLIINLCGLGLALVLAAENIYINDQVTGSASVGSYWGIFVPAVLICLFGRGKIVYVSLVIYALLVLYIGYLALAIYFEVLQPGLPTLKGIGFYQGIPLLLLLACFGIYVVVEIIRCFLRLLKPAPKNQG